MIKADDDDDDVEKRRGGLEAIFPSNLFTAITGQRLLLKSCLPFSCHMGGGEGKGGFIVFLFSLETLSALTTTAAAATPFGAIFG